MPAARYWRLARIETFAGGDLELSEVALYEGATRVDGSATVSSVVAPVSGALSDLGDASFSTSARWPGDAVRLPGFAVVWDFGAGVTKDVSSVGVAGPSQATFAHRFAVSYSDNGTDWTAIYSPPVASKWPGASAFYEIDAPGTADDWPALLIGYGGTTYASAYTRNGDSFAYAGDIAGASELPYCFDVTSDGKDVYVGGGRIYNRSGLTLTPGILFDAAPVPVVRDAAFSQDGVYLATASMNNSPYINIFKRSGDTFTKLANPATLPTGHSYGAAFDPTGTYLAVGHSASPYLTIYKRSGDTFTKLANPATLPTGSGSVLEFDVTGNYLAVSHSVSPYLTVYSRSGDTFTKLADPATLPTGGDGRALSIDPTGTYIAHGGNGSSAVSIYKLVAGALSYVTSLTGVGAAVNGLAFDSTGTYLAVSRESGAGVLVYQRTGDSFALVSTIVPNGAPYTYGVKFLPFGALATNMQPANYDATPLRTDDQAAPSMLGEDVAGFTQAFSAATPPQLDIYDAGRGRITGTVKERAYPADIPVKRRVALLSMPGSRAIRETWSDSVTGEYEFAEIAMDRTYTVVSYDHTGTYMGEVADNVQPTLMA